MKTKSKRIATMLSVLLASAAFAQNGADLLQKALRKEQVEGDINGAIALYKQIAGEKTANRSITAQSLLQLGKAYEKLGANEAKSAYTRVIADFSDQAREVNEAKSRLSVLDKAGRNEQGAGETPQPVLKQIASNATDRWVAFGDGWVSPNGRYLTYINWTHGNLGFFDFGTGELRDLTTEATWAGNPDQFASRGVWSPDSERIAYEWSKGPAGELRLVHRNGGASTLLVSARISPRVWSRNGKHIYALGPQGKSKPNWPERQEALVLVDATTGATNVIKKFKDEEYVFKLTLSPDGKYLAYTVRHDDGSAELSQSDIRIMDVDGANDRSLIEHPADEANPQWMPDGKHLLFLSDRSGEQALWAVPMNGNQATREPRFVRTGVTGREFSVTDDGAVYFYSDSANVNIYIAEADFDEAKIGTPKVASLRHDGKNRNPAWSADGSRLGYVSMRNPAVLVFQDVATGKEEEVKPDWIWGWGGFGPAWAPDFSRLIGPGRHPARRGNALFSVDAKSGRRSLLEVPNSKEDVAGPVFGRDGQCLFYGRMAWTEGGPPPGIIELNLATMQDRFITSELSGYRQPIAVSPDGSQLAAIATPYPPKARDTVKLLLVSRSAGTSRTIVEFPITEKGGGFVCDWLPDNRRLIVAIKEKDQQPQQLYLVDVETGTFRPFQAPSPKPNWTLKVHPDGKRVVFDAGRMASEIWSMKNFLPDQKVAAVEDQPIIKQVASDKLGPWVAFGGGSPSPDGRYMAYVNWTHGNLAVADLQNQTLNDLTTEGTWNPPDQFTFGGIWSPDSTRIAYLWMKGGEGDLRTIHRDGGQSRIIVPANKGERIVPQSWSKDGRFIFGSSFLTEPPHKNRIVRVDVLTGKIDLIVEFPGPSAWVRLSLSPDEKQIAYDFPGGDQLKYMGKDPVPNQIRIVNLDGSNDRLLIDHPANDTEPCWLPNGKHLLFRSDRSGETALWAIATQQGSFAEPRTVREAPVGQLLGASDDGTVFYSARSLNFNIFVAAADFDAGTLGSAKLVSLSYDGKNRNPRWSADGTKLGYVSGRNVTTLVFQNSVTGQEETVEIPHVRFGERPLWSPDLSKLIGPARVPGGNVWGLYNIDVKAKHYSLVISESAPWGIFSPSGNQFIYRKELKTGPQIIEHNVKDNQERVIGTNDVRLPVLLSPDGSSLAYRTQPYPPKEGQSTKLIVISVIDGSTKIVREFPIGPGISPLDWLPDNRHLLVTSSDREDNQQLRVIDTLSNTDRPFGPLLRGDQRISSVSIHPNGKRIAFARGRFIEEVWTIKNFLPDDKLAAR